MTESRWLLQELRTPQPVSIMRLDKLWVQIKSLFMAVSGVFIA